MSSHVHEENQLRVYWPRYFPHTNDECARFPTLHPNAGCTYPGIMAEIIGILVRDLNLTLVSLTDAKEEDDADPDEDGEVGMERVASGTADITALAYQYSASRAQRFDFSKKDLYRVGTRYLRRKRVQAFYKAWSFFETYSWNTWMTFASAWLLQMAFCVLVRRFEARAHGKESLGLVDCTWSILRLQLLQPDRLPFKSVTGNFSILVFSFFQCSILVGLFSSFILASIIKRGTGARDPVAELIGAVTSREGYIVDTDPNHWFFQHINTSIMGQYRELCEALASNPVRLVGTTAEAFERIIDGDAIMFQQTDDRDFYTAMSECRIQTHAQSMQEVGAYLVMRKAHPLLSRLNSAILRNRLRFEKIASKYYRLALAYDQCPVETNYRPLSLSPYIGVAIVCLAIIGLGVLAFLCELVAPQIRRALIAF